MIPLFIYAFLGYNNGAVTLSDARIMNNMITQLSVAFLLFLISVSSYAGERACMNYNWSDNPGAFESQLKRKCNSHYFPVTQRQVTKEEIKEAKEQDISDYSLAKSQLLKLEAKVHLTEGESNFETLNSLRQELDDLILFSLGVGGLGIELADTANSLRKRLILRIKKLYQENSNALSRIDKAVKYHDNVVEPFYIPFISQLRRKDGPIKPEEMLYSLLSESPKTIGFVMGKMPPEIKAKIRLLLLNTINEAVERGEIESNLEEKIVVISGF